MMNLVARTEGIIVNGITHDGVFHADEVFTTVILKRYFRGDFCVRRTSKVPKNLPNNVIVYDVGEGKYDHHQEGGNGCRKNGVPYASAGLIWKEFGYDVIPDYCADKQFVWNIIDRDLIQGIDAVDNGKMPTADYACRVMTISNIIGGFNPTWNSLKSADDCFEEAVEFAERIFDNVMNSALSKLDARAFVEEAIMMSQEASDEKRFQGRRIMLLDRFVPWQEFVLTSKNKKTDEMLYVVYPSSRGGFNVQCVPDALGSFVSRKLLPENWRGLPQDELRRKTGVETAIFCHPNGFIGGTETLEDAVKMAKIAALTA